MDIKVSQTGDSGRLEIFGDIDEKGAEAFKARLQELKTAKKVEIDFSHVGYIGSSGIGKLLLFYKNVTLEGGKVTVSNLSSDLYSLFRELKLDTIFTITQK
ncbi:MAG TPA: STAS domain-containing protein [Smithellaceae bacterium]|nr:STAS domain-containing protein [Smithellaceae bacterium]